jgi:hypothetical protein
MRTPAAAAPTSIRTVVPPATSKPATATDSTDVALQAMVRALSAIAWRVATQQASDGASGEGPETTR